MPAWPKSFLKFGASVRTAATARKLNGRNGVKAQNETLQALTGKLAAATWWQQAGIVGGMRYEDFCSRVPPRRHADLQPAIERMENGEANVLWPGRCTFFATTAGTTTGEPCAVPVTADALAHFRAASTNALWYYTARMGHAGVCGGRHLYLGGNTALKPTPTADGGETYRTELGGIVTLSLPPAADQHLLEPGSQISNMSEGRAKFDAIATRTSRVDISLLAGLPSWVLYFAEAMRKQGSQQKGQLVDLQALWPNLECLMHVGMPIAPFQRELRQVLGPNVRFHEVYAACEGIIGAQDAEAAAGLRLMTDVGLFFEFIPLADFDERRLEQLGTKAVPLADVKVGLDYVVLLTTPAGLVRYCLGDIIRFTSTAPARFIYCGRTALWLDGFGERVAERELTEAIVAVCVRHQWSLVNFHVAPRFEPGFTTHNRGAYEWWIELRPGLRETPTGPNLATELDTELQKLSADYAKRRKAGAVGVPTVRLLMPGVFEHWLRFRGRWGGQNKTPHSRGDRLMADELGQITIFARD